MIDEVRSRLDRAIEEKVFPGCAVGIVDGNKKSPAWGVIARGHLTYSTKSPPVTVDTPYDIASLTKVFTSMVLLTCVEQGKISLDDQIVKFLPEFGVRWSQKRSVRIRHLLTFTLNLDIPSLKTLKEKTPEEVIHIIMDAPLLGSLGENVQLVNATAMLMGLIFEQIYPPRKLNTAMHELFFDPLGMKSTTFRPLSLFKKEVIAPTELCPWRNRLLQGEVHDESTSVFGERYLGASGLFSTAFDLSKFVHMLLHEGTSNGKNYFSPDTVRSLSENQKRGLREKTSYGWRIALRRYMGRTCSEKTIGGAGFTGTSIVIDMERRVGIILLSNRVHPHRPKNSDAINAVRRDVADIVFRHIDKQS